MKITHCSCCGWKPAPVKPAWTAEQTATLKRMWADNASVAEIAEAVGKTISAVHNKRNKIRLASRSVKKFSRWTPAAREAHAERLRIQWTPELIQAVRECRAKGWGVNKMADFVGVTGTTILKAEKRGVFA